MITQKLSTTSQNLSPGRVILYTGPGADNSCVESTRSALSRHLDPSYSLVDFPSPLFNIFERSMYPQSIRAIVVPGGSVVKMRYPQEIPDNKLTTCMEMFKTSLNLYNTSYYGICAGALMGTSRVYGRDITDEFFVKPKDIVHKDLALLGLAPVSSFAPIFPKSDIENENILDKQLVEIDHDSTPGKFMLHVSGPMFSPPVRFDATSNSYFYESRPEVEILHRYPPRVTRPSSFGMESIKIIQDETSQCFESAETIFYQAPEKSRIVLSGCHREMNKVPLKEGPIQIHAHPDTTFSRYDEFFENPRRVTNQLLEESQPLRDRDIKLHLQRLGLNTI